MGTGLYKKGRFFAAMGIVVFLCIYGTAIKVHHMHAANVFLLWQRFVSKIKRIMKRLS